MNQQRENMFQGKKTQVEGLDFFQISGGIDQEVMGVLINIHF